jgi:hypothetical protein
MAAALTDRSGSSLASTSRWRRAAWIAMLAADAGLLAWAAMAALAPEHLLGPGGGPILPAEFEGFTGQSWQELAQASPRAGEFMTVIFRVYGAYGVGLALLAMAVAATAFRRGEQWAWWALLVTNTIAFGAAMRFDWVVNAIGPFELTEYLGLAVVYAALAVTAPFGAAARPALRHAAL